MVLSIKNKKFYITTSIAYTNALPHIGFALELVQADVISRYHRILGEDVFFLTGTDEHGFKIAEAAEKEGKKPEVFVKEVSDKFKELASILNISNNDFIRTTDEKKHWSVVREVWKKLEEKKDLYLKDYEGWYCKGCEAFITERKEDKGFCLVHHNIKPELVHEKNWFFKLSEYQDEIREKIESNELKIIPETRKNEVLGILNQEWTEFVDGKKIIKKGLEDISFSRLREKLKWGIPVPGDEKNQTIYVWADALTNYISALGFPNSREFKKYWPADVQCIGKDILKFHSLIWPAMLLSLGLELPKTIFVHGFITADGQKMSKSLGNVVDPFELVEKYGVDAVRYFLLREIPATEDGDFSYEKFIERYNGDLAKGLGNLVSRTLTLAEKFKIKEAKSSPAIAESFLNISKGKYDKALKDFKFNEGLIAIWEIIGKLDKYIDKEEPWKGGEKAIEVISDSLFVLEEIAKLLQPFLPGTSERIFQQLKIKKSEILFPVKK
jgi:methionyl-tRNA synthetase